MVWGARWRNGSARVRNGDCQYWRADRRRAPGGAGDCFGPRGMGAVGHARRGYRRPMPTATERKALLFLGAVACLGGGVRVVRAREIPPPPASARRALDAQISAVDSTRRQPSPPGRGRRRAASRDTNPPGGAPRRPRGGRARSVRLPPDPPLGSFNRLDVDRATVVELQRLPGIGPALAARIVAYRDSNGPFGSMDRLRRVKGIGPATAARLDSLVSFWGRRGP